MFKKMMYGVFFAVCCTCAHAEAATPSQWEFSWTGFTVYWPPGDYSNKIVSGTFSGNDSNHNGKIELGELSELIIGGSELTNCGTSASRICKIDSFSYVLGGKLDLTASYETSFGELGTEDWSSKKSTYVAGDYIAVEERARQYYWEMNYYFTPDTVVSINPVLAPVPEPGSLAMLMAGLFMLGSTLRRKKR